MKNTQLPQITGLKNLQLTENQANTLLDLVSDQICIQRAYLRETPLHASYTGSLTQLRHLKNVLSNKVREIAREEEDREESEDIFNFFIQNAQ